MKLKYCIVIAGVWLFTQPVVQAQYKGGYGDGAAIKQLVQLNPLSNIYKGTGNDGYAGSVIWNRNGIANIYAGKYGDGFGYTYGEQLNYQPNIYAGGNGDGYHGAVENSINILNNIYAGGQADGYAGTSLLNLNNSINIYTGGNGNGFSANQIFLLNGLNEIYSGGNGNGFASIVIYQTNQTSLLPLKLEGEWQQDDIALHWINKNETGYSYLLERSTGEGNRFIKIAGFDSSPGKPKNTRTDYTDNDTRYADIFYYRVKRINKNGIIESSAIIRLSKPAKQISGSIYPNPGAGIFHISIQNEKNITQYSFRVLNAAGKLLQQGNLISAVTQFDISRHAAGIYYVQLFKEGQLQNTYTIILQH